MQALRRLLRVPLLVLLLVSAPLVGQGHAFIHHGLHHGDAGPGKRGATEAAGFETEYGNGHESDDCPLCHLLGPGEATGSPVVGIPQEIWEESSTLESILLAREHRGIESPRGPPAGRIALDR